MSTKIALTIPTATIDLKVSSPTIKVSPAGSLNVVTLTDFLKSYNATGWPITNADSYTPGENPMMGSVLIDDNGFPVVTG